jgi:hypothetical protein
MLHEGFYVHQYEQSDKFADKSLIVRYPLYDAANGALRRSESSTVRRLRTHRSSPSRRLGSLRWAMDRPSTSLSRWERALGTPPACPCASGPR